MYEVIKASSPQEAVEKSKFKVGGLTKCVKVSASANGDKTFSVFHEVEPFDLRKLAVAIDGCGTNIPENEGVEAWLKLLTELLKDD